MYKIFATLIKRIKGTTRDCTGYCVHLDFSQPKEKKQQNEETIVQINTTWLSHFAFICE